MQLLISTVTGAGKTSGDYPKSCSLLYKGKLMHFVSQHGRDQTKPTKCGVYN